jgi:hypothetical protein
MSSLATTRPRLLAVLSIVAVLFITPGVQAQDARAARSDPAAYGPEVERDVKLVRAATEAFKDIEAAVAAGFPRVVTGCLANGASGGMGHHHSNRARLDATVEVGKPEILLYSYHPDGSYVLNGVEYIVPFRAWPQDSVPPRVMGRDMIPSESLKLWYLHAWIWTPNAQGLFSDWNPVVTCRK